MDEFFFWNKTNINLVYDGFIYKFMSYKLQMLQKFRLRKWKIMTGKMVSHFVFNVIHCSVSSAR